MIKWFKKSIDTQGTIIYRNILKFLTKKRLIKLLVNQVKFGWEKQHNWHFLLFKENQALKEKADQLELTLKSYLSTDKNINRAMHVALLEESNRKLRREIRQMQLEAEAKNNKMEALGYIVYCTGCDAGGPTNFKDLTEDKVKSVENIAARLRAWWNNHNNRLKRK